MIVSFRIRKNYFTGASSPYVETTDTFLLINNSSAVFTTERKPYTFKVNDRKDFDPSLDTVTHLSISVEVLSIDPATMAYIRVTTPVDQIICYPSRLGYESITIDGAPVKIEVRTPQNKPSAVRVNFLTISDGPATWTTSLDSNQR